MSTSLNLRSIGVYICTAALCLVNQAHAASPVRFVNNPLVPTSAAPGSPALTLTVNGANFVQGATVYWNGSARATSFVTATQLTASITAADVADAGTSAVSVSNPGRAAMSNVSYFSISKPRSVETTPVSFALSSQQWASDLYYIAAADFNGDGKIDLAGIDLTESTLSILLGNGDGTFQSPISYSVADYPAGIAVGDFNNDGKPDLALEGSSGGLHMLTIFLGNGDGTFAALPAVPAGAGTYLPSLAIGDFNGDGNADIATANVDNLADNVAIFLGNGDGTFQAYKNTQVNASSSFPIADVKVGDLNRDGKLDVAALIAPMGAIPGTLYVLLGTGNGDFGSPISVTTKQPAGQFALGDINGDGITDVVTNGGGIEYLRGRGDGTFESQAQIETFSGTFGIALGDLNADNRLDVLTSTFYDGSTIVMNEKGGFGEPVTLPTGSAVVSYQTAIADFNNDGQPDFVASYTGVYLSVSSYLSPLSLVFPYGTTGVPDAPQTITLTNSGPRGIDITGFTFSATSGCLAIIDLPTGGVKYVPGPMDAFVIRGGSHAGDLIYMCRLDRKPSDDDPRAGDYAYIHARPDGAQIAIISNESLDGGNAPAPILRTYLRSVHGRIFVQGEWVD
jgi:hypothetical protein